jgi:hypothetical protein
MKLDLYDLSLVSEDQSLLAFVPLGTPEARGWLKRFAKEIEDASYVVLSPKEGFANTVPPVLIHLHGERKLIYKRVTRGAITTSGMGNEDMEFSFYEVGYEDHSGKHTARIYAKVTPTIEIGGI